MAKIDLGCDACYAGYMPQVHRNNFDFIRFAAAVMVWYSHCYALTGIGADPITSIMPFQSFGGLGVAIFFIVSGYFITMSYERQERVLPYLRNRALRILPALWVVVLLSVFVFGALATTLSFHNYFAHPLTWRYLRTMLVFPLQYELPGVFEHNLSHAVNGSLWTLQQEARCYIVIAILGVLGILQPRVMTALFICFAAILVYGAICGNKPPEFFLTVRWMKLQFAVHYAFLFCGGSLVYMFRDLIPRHIGFLTGCFLLMVFSTRLSNEWGAILFDLALIYSVIYLGFLQVPLLHDFGRFGDFSYGIYLYAFPMQQLTLGIMGGKSFFAFMLVSFIATLICAIGSWFLVEQPALRYKN